MPQGRGANGDAQLCQQTLAQLLQAQIRLLMDPLAQQLIMSFKSGAAVSTARFGLQCALLHLTFPLAFYAAFGHAKNTREFLGALPPLASGH